jgi:hypothetical protein
MINIEKFIYPYYFYGSADSTDKDVIIHIPQKDMPKQQEERKQFVWHLQKEYQLDWNATLAVIENGYMVDTIYTKSWIDRLNNALFTTYPLHVQNFPNPIVGKMRINRLLSIYKAVRTVLSLLTRTHLRPLIRPTVNGIHDFNLKLKALHHIQWIDLQHFNQRNAADIDIWKTLAFYIYQNIALLENGTEVYTKQHCVAMFPTSENFIYRKPITEQDKTVFQQHTNHWIEMVTQYGHYVSEMGFLSCNGERINMKDEIFVNT